MRERVVRTAPVLSPRSSCRAEPRAAASEGGTASALPKRGFVLQGRHAIRIRVLDAIPYARFANESAEAVAERVRTLIAAELGPEHA